MTCRKDNAACSLFHCNRQFGSRRGSQANVYYIKAHSQQSTDNYLSDHLSGNAGIPSHYDFIGINGFVFTNVACISSRKTNNIKGTQPLADSAPDGTPNTGN
ncbi:hypothetical protein SDC9_46507 [bioreactor metagenome]|uniref:Uncharacterized protein n=1 Tax=bioreactor metagenome TaxID=1076179 RepID=A0A644WD70_9ZZZZ